ncbi:hypothetical protein A2U01_0029064 [Trifolium medium]|uniref:Uncharacterized protein n=1 Tax=Trifolium medium TaxID=97028 RepID=A0A392P883_9FABA|nr:hypothetical protein [Trifolium medium]
MGSPKTQELMKTMEDYRGTVLVGSPSESGFSLSEDQQNNLLLHVADSVSVQPLLIIAEHGIKSGNQNHYRGKWNGKKSWRLLNEGGTFKIDPEFKTMDTFLLIKVGFLRALNSS